MKLEELLGPELYAQVKEKLDAVNEKEADKLKHVRYADLSEGNYVSKIKYDELAGEKKSLEEKVETMNSTIKQLKKDNGDNEELQNTIKDLNTKIKDMEAKADDTRKLYALKESLAKSGVIDVDYIIYKQGGVDEFTFDKEGNPVGIEDILKSYKENPTTAHLFKKDQAGGGYAPKKGGTGAEKNPFAKDSLNLTEQGKLIKEDPARARELAAAAGITI